MTDSPRELTEELARTRLARQTLQRWRLRREAARRDYAAYLSLVHGPASDGGVWIPTRFSSFLAGEIQAFLEARTGNAYDILVLETPPQHGKSMTVTETLPSWYMMRNPENRVILASYNEDSAERFSRRNREKLLTWGPLLFGVRLGGLNRANAFEIAGHRGRLISRGIMSGITGHPAELLIIDDPVKNREEADSPAYRDKLWNEWLNSLHSRLSAGAKVILIMTPWHEDDLAARILRTEENTRLLRLPVEAGQTADPLRREPGEALCPELGKGQAWLAQFRRAYLSDPEGGARAWAALYMCSPRVEGGNLVRRDWWRYYDGLESLPALPVQIISVDAAFKGGENNDFVAITVWGKRDLDCYLLDCQNRHLTFTETLKAIRETRKRFPDAATVLIEDKANGSAIVDVLQREMCCLPVDPEGGKVARVQAVAGWVETGHVFLPRRAPWLEDYLNQWTAFPAGPHDDMVDSSSQALNYLRKRSIPRDLTAEERRRADEAEEARESITGTDLFDVYGGGYDSGYENGYAWE